METERPRVPDGDMTIREFREWLKMWIEKSREEQGESFDIEGALRLAKSRAQYWIVAHKLQSEYSGELKEKFALDPSRCRYCGNSLELYPGMGRYCDICTDKFSDYDGRDEFYEDEYDPEGD